MSRRRGEFRVLETPRQYSGMIISRLINARTIIIKYADAWTEGRLGVAVVASSRRATTMPLVRFRLRLRIIHQINCAWTSLLLLSFRASPRGLSLSLSLSILLFFHSLSLADSSQVSAGSRRVTLPAYHFRGLPFSATTHTKGGGGPPSPLCVGAHTRQKWHSFLQYRASRAPQRCVSSLREILTRIEYKKIYNARSIIMKQAESSPPAVYLIPSLFPFYNTRLSFSPSLRLRVFLPPPW